MADNDDIGADDAHAGHTGALGVDVVDDGFRDDATTATSTTSTTDDSITDDAAVDDRPEIGADSAITSFLTGEAAMGQLRERPWSRFTSMARYTVRDALRGLRRRPALAASAALTVALCALLAGGAAIARAGVDATMSRWADGVEFVVYLDPGADRADVARVAHELEDADGVRKVTRVTQQDAYREYRRLYADDASMTEAVTPDLLPSSFRVAPEDADPGLIQRITRPLASDPAVYQVVTADQAVEDVRDLSGAVSGFGTWLAIVLGIVGIVLSATMIRSSISSRQREIEMMRSLGAGRTYIAAPVAFEGVIIGLVGAGVAAALLAIGLARARGSDSSVVTSLLPPTADARGVIVLVVVVTVLVCTAVSVLTTASALRRAR